MHCNRRRIDGQSNALMNHNHSISMNNDHNDLSYDIIREPSPMISDSGETSSERGGMMQAALAAAAMNERSPAQKAVIVHEDESDIILAPQYSNSNNSGSGGSSRPPAATVNGRSPRLQGQTGALFKADPLSLSSSGPTTALNIMRRSGGGRSNSNSDTTNSGSGGASLTQDSGVPRSVTTVSPHPTSETPVISNVDSRRSGNNGERRLSGDMPPSSAMDYPPSGVPNWGGSGYPAYPNAHDIHRARWEQEQRELAADYYPSAGNYPFDYYNTPGSYYQQHPPPASLRYNRQPLMTAETSNAAAERLAMEHRLQVEQHRMHDYYTPRVHSQIPPSMTVHPHQAQILHQQQQQQQLQRPGQNEGGANAESKPPSRRSSSPSPGVSSAQRYQVHHQQQRSGSPAISSIQRNQVHQQMQRSGSPSLSSVQRNHRRNHSQQQQQSRHAYEERDWRTNQVWREDDHSQTASSLGGLKIPTPPPAAAAAIERGRADNSGADFQPSSSLHPRSQKQSSQQQRRGSGGITIDQYDISHAQMYGQSPYVQDSQQLPPHVSATPSPPPAPVPPPPTPLMTSIDPRIQHQMNLMAVMFQQQQGAGLPPPHISPMPRGLMYPGQYFTQQHNYFQGGLAGAVNGQPPMPQEVIVPAPSDAEDGKNTAETADSTGLTPRLGPVAVDEIPPPVPRDKSSKVSFSHLQIRTYETILGDNPSCTGGPSLSIGWRYNPEHFESTVDEYELQQDEFYGGPGIRPLDIDLVLHRSERESILLKLGYTQSDLAEAVRRLNKAKSKRRQTVHNLPVMFLEEKAESCKRSLGRLFMTRQRTRHMYDEWKKGEKVTPKERRNSL